MKDKIESFIAFVSALMLMILVLIPRPQITEVIVVKSNAYNSCNHNTYNEEIYVDGVNLDELYLLAHLIMGECGAAYLDDEMLYLTGVVALNRVKSKYFPNTLEEVVYQKGQYQCVELKTSGFYKEPTDRCWKISLDLLSNGYDAPENVVYQAEFVQGKIYKKIQNMYFCYK